MNKWTLSKQNERNNTYLLRKWGRKSAASNIYFTSGNCCGVLFADSVGNPASELANQQRYSQTHNAGKCICLWFLYQSLFVFILSVQVGVYGKQSNLLNTIAMKKLRFHLLFSRQTRKQLEFLSDWQKTSKCTVICRLIDKEYENILRKLKLKETHYDIAN
jgi:hypothetical protein